MHESKALTCGDTVVMRKSVSEEWHLWILLTAPDQSTGEVVIVNVTTLRPHSDRTVILTKGDHPFITHDSVVFYSDAQFSNAQLIEAAIKAGICTKCDPVSDELLRRIQGGLLQSTLTPAKIRNVCQKAWRVNG